MPFVFSPTETRQSESCPGVTFTIRRPSVASRAELNLKHSKDFRDIDRWEREFRKLIVKHKPSDNGEPKEPREIEFADEDRAMDLLANISAAQEGVLTPALVKWALINVEGLEIEDSIDCENAAKMLLEIGPEPLVREIADAIRESMGLSPLQQKNSQSLTTSPAPAEATIPSMSADTASSRDTIVAEAAKGILT